MARLSTLSQHMRSEANRVIQQALPPSLKRHVLFLRFHGRWGQFARPRTFSEKVNWRILYDRRPELAWTCDKLESKRRANAVGVRSPVTYWQGDDIAALANVALPEYWVLKPNHRSGLVYFGRGHADIDTLTVTAGWTDETLSRLLGEWAYSQARRLLLVEEQLEPEGTPLDYKFFVMDGKTQIIQVDVDRFGDHRRNIYTPTWQPVNTQYLYPRGDLLPPPENLTEMLDSAERIAGTLDFLRVDLYNVAGEIYLGEVAAYPGGGLERHRPYSYDRELGSYWRLPITSA